MRFILSLVILWFAPSLLAADLDAMWKEAVAANTVQAPNQRVKLFSEWIDAAAAQGVRSADAYAQLASAYWDLPDVGKAVFYQLEGAKLRDNPFAAWRVLGHVHQIESEQAVREGLSTAPSLYLYFFFTPALVLAFVVFSFWSLVGAGFLYWYRGKRWTPVSMGLVSFALFCATVPAAAAVTRRFYFKPLAVIDVPKGASLGVYQTAEAKEENKIIALPAGILVRPEEVQGTFTRISQPLSGWIDSASLRTMSLQR